MELSGSNQSGFLKLHGQTLDCSKPNSNTLKKFALPLWICQTQQQWAAGMVTSPEGSMTARAWEALDQKLTTLRGHWSFHISDTHV